MEKSEKRTPAEAGQQLADEYPRDTAYEKCSPEDVARRLVDQHLRRDKMSLPRIAIQTGVEAAMIYRATGGDMGDYAEWKRRFTAAFVEEVGKFYCEED